MPPPLPRRRLLQLSVLLPAWAAARGAVAQTGTALRVLLPVGPGSGVDTIVRAAQTALSRALGGQPVQIENLPGAGGITGTQALVRAAPDGQTVGFISNNHAVNPSVFKSLPYDSLGDITPICVLGSSPFVLLVPAQLPVRSARELQAHLLARRGAANYGSPGVGTILHLAAELFVDATGASVQHIPYRGLAPMLNDLIGGQIDLAVSAVGPVQGHLQSGNLRALGVLSEHRLASLPEVPTLAEQGFADMVLGGWFALVAPRGLAPARVQTLHAAAVAAFQDPEVRAAMARQDTLITPMSPERSAQFLASEQARYARLAQRAGITPG